MRSHAKRSAALVAALLLASCASDRARHAGPVRVPRASPQRPVPDGPAKLGAPYQVAGRWYTPADDRGYDTVGLASWYGPGFDGRYTANGEYYDPAFVTAAHKTLPLPSYAEVTALDTGRSIVVRVNDRGPFVGDRLIDLSRGAAARLGTQRAAVTRVRVRRVYPDEHIRLALRSGLSPDAPLSNRTVALARASAPPPVIAPPRVPIALPPAAPIAVAVIPTAAELDRDAVPLPESPVVATADPFAGPAWVQVAAVADEGRASWLAGFLRPIGLATIEAAGGGLWRVKLGPYADETAAREALAKVQAAGYQEAHLVRVAPAVEQ